MARRGRGAGRAPSRRTSARNTRAAPIRTPSPVEASDEEMQDAPESGQATPQQGGDDEDEDGDDGEIVAVDAEVEDEDEVASDQNESEPPSRNATPAGFRASHPRRRRAGRPPKQRTHDADSNEGGSDVGTPKRRGGWRGGRGFGGGRWRNKGGPSQASQVPLDKEGNMANVVDDEVQLPEDLDGETKVDKMGRLQGGREYRVRVFTISGKGDRLYMLSTEPARCIGFRDSYLFFQKHRQLYKIILPEEAKRDLIERTIIPHSYKGRAIGVVTARSVYREFGSRIIIGGKKIIDDYAVEEARKNGDIEGDLAVPDDRLPQTGQGYDKNRYVAWHGASSVYHSGMPNIPIVGKGAEGKKRRVQVTGSNWMFEHAQAASRFNSFLAHQRRQNLEGVYEIHTNCMHYPKIMQPSHVKWEQLPVDASMLLDEIPTTMSNANGHSTDGFNTSEDNPSTDENTMFPPISRAFASHVLTVDTVYRNPPISNLGVPGPDGDIYDIGTRSLDDVPDEVLEELPEDCKQAFLEAHAEELGWKTYWGNEKQDGMRAGLTITYSGM
ncbi:hypothetical protein MMC25_003928 [Agyrium rufum]|nr:hypothetical protein [Agyrium rufum]